MKKSSLAMAGLMAAVSATTVAPAAFAESKEAAKEEIVLAACHGCKGCHGCDACEGCHGCDGCAGCGGCEGCHGCHGEDGHDH